MTKYFPYTEEFYQHHKFCCPYYGEFEYYDRIYKIPTCQVATALTIYYHIFYRSECYAATNQRPLNFASLLFHFRHREVPPGNYFELLINRLKPLTPQSVEQIKSTEFYDRAKHLLLTSHEWDWVIPLLHKVYPQLIFGELE